GRLAPNIFGPAKNNSCTVAPGRPCYAGSMSLATESTETSIFRHEGWTLHTTHEIGSTNSAAAKLPAWHAVRDDLQTDGRGRTGRRWVSDEGGLWLSAVVPCPGQRSRWAILPLAAGWAIIGALRD